MACRSHGCAAVEKNNYYWSGMLPIPCCEGASLSRNPKSLNLVHLYACICFIKIVLEYWNTYYFKVFYANRIGVINAKSCTIPTDQSKQSIKLIKRHRTLPLSKKKKKNYPQFAGGKARKYCNHTLHSSFGHADKPFPYCIWVHLHVSHVWIQRYNLEEC